MNFNRDRLKSSSLSRQSLLQRGDMNGLLSAGQVQGEHSFQTATQDRKIASQSSFIHGAFLTLQYNE